MTEFLQNVTFLHVVALVLVIVYMFTILFGKRYRLRLREADMKQDVVLPPHE